MKRFFAPHYLLASLISRHSARERAIALQSKQGAKPVFIQRGEKGWAKESSKAFLEELPSYLLAVASGLRVGLAPLAALERSARLLAPTSPLQREVQNLLEDLHRGEAKEDAIAHFAKHIRLEELSLFRSALLINWEHGGQLGRTLTQISHSTRERQALISSAKVTTTVMNMTANVMIVVAPLLIGVIASRYPNYFEILGDNPVAATTAILGAVLLIGGLTTLKQMCRFHP